MKSPDRRRGTLGKTRLGRETERIDIESGQVAEAARQRIDGQRRKGIAGGNDGLGSVVLLLLLTAAATKDNGMKIGGGQNKALVKANAVDVGAIDWMVVARNSTVTSPDTRKGTKETARGGRSGERGRGGDEASIGIGRDIFVDADRRNGCRDPLGPGRRRDCRGSSSGGGGRRATGIVVVVAHRTSRSTSNDARIWDFRLVSDRLGQK